MNKAFSKILIVVIAAIIIGGGVLVWQQGWLIIQDREEGGWKTYTNKQYAFEIKYPSELARKELLKDNTKSFQFTKGDISAELFVRDFDRVDELWCQDAGGAFQSIVEIMGEEHSKCLRPEPGALIISEYSVSIGQRGNYFFDFDCGNLFYESQVCDKILSTFRFLK